jgi:hypothetical protein
MRVFLVVLCAAAYLRQLAVLLRRGEPRRQLIHRHAVRVAAVDAYYDGAARVCAPDLPQRKGCCLQEGVSGRCGKSERRRSSGVARARRVGSGAVVLCGCGELLAFEYPRRLRSVQPNNDAQARAAAHRQLTGDASCRRVRACEGVHGGEMRVWGVRSGRRCLQLLQVDATVAVDVKLARRRKHLPRRRPPGSPAQNMRWRRRWRVARYRQLWQGREHSGWLGSV